MPLLQANLVELWATLYEQEAAQSARLRKHLQSAHRRARRQHLQFCLVLAAAALALPSTHDGATPAQMIAAVLIAVATLIEPLCEYTRITRSTSGRSDGNQSGCHIDSE